MSDQVKALLIEDDPALSKVVSGALTDEGIQCSTASRADEGIRLLQADSYDVVISDIQLPGNMDGLSLVQELHRKDPRLPIILTTAYGTSSIAIEATKRGAFDYLQKPFQIPELVSLIEKGAKCRRMAEERVSMGKVSSNGHRALVGNSRRMQQVYTEIGRVAPSPVNVMIRGESGAGKELVARAVYQHSDREDGPFIAVNCLAIPETLLESELFGHEKGAFTGADSRKIGRFEQANHGTIFLDEIGDMTPSTQGKLLRVLEDRCIQRLGGRESIPIDVRIIAATHVDLEQAVADGSFRRDLYYRLRVVMIQLPSLKERGEDIPVLADYFIKRHGAALGFPNSTIEKDAVELLQKHPWPGNVRELENVIREAILLARDYPICSEHLLFSLSTDEIIENAEEASSWGLGHWVADKLKELEGCREGYEMILDEVESEIFAQALRQANFNKAKMARFLKISRPTAYEKLRKHGLQPTQEAA